MSSLSRIIREGGRRGEIYQATARSARQIRRIRSRNDSRKSRDEFPVTIWTSCCRKRISMSLARSWARESTCVLILEATLELIARSAGAFASRPRLSRYLSRRAITSRDVRKYKPVGLEGIDDVLIDAMKTKHIHPRDLKILPERQGWLVVEFGGRTTRRSGRARRTQLMEELKARRTPPAMKLIDDPEQEAVIWEIRDSGLGASARVPNEPDTWEGWEDSAVSPNDIGKYLRDFRALLKSTAISARFTDISARG